MAKLIKTAPGFYRVEGMDLAVLVCRNRAGYRGARRTDTTYRCFSTVTKIDLATTFTLAAMKQRVAKIQEQLVAVEAIEKALRGLVE